MITLKLDESINSFTCGNVFGFVKLIFPFYLNFQQGMASRDLVMDLIDKAIGAAQVRIDTEPQGNASQDALTILLSQSSKSKDKLTHDELRDTCMEMLFSSVEGKKLMNSCHVKEQKIKSRFFARSFCP